MNSKKSQYISTNKNVEVILKDKIEEITIYMGKDALQNLANRPLDK